MKRRNMKRNMMMILIIKKIMKFMNFKMKMNKIIELKNIIKFFLFLIYKFIFDL